MIYGEITEFTICDDRQVSSFFLPSIITARVHSTVFSPGSLTGGGGGTPGQSTSPGRDRVPPLG